MQIQRYSRQRGNQGCLVSGCGCFAVLGAVLVAGLLSALLLIPRLPNIMLQALGFAELGNTEAIFAATQAPPMPLVDSQAIQGQVVMNLPNLGRIALADVPSLTLQNDASTGQVQLTLGEDSLLNLCQQLSEVCSPTGAQARNLRFDLRNGGLIAQGELYIAQLGAWQSVGMALQFTPDGASVRVAGVDVNGTLYAAPPDGLGDLVRQFEQIAADALKQARFEANGQVYALTQLYANDTLLTMIMR